MLVCAPLTQEYLNNLIAAYPSISEVWLIGSRANDSAEPGSDWDYLAWSDDAAILTALHHDSRFNVAGVDLLIVIANGDFMKPWQEADGSWKKGGLKLWEWKRISDTEARYNGQPAGESDPGSPPISTKAQLIYRRMK